MVETTYLEIQDVGHPLPNFQCLNRHNSANNCYISLKLGMCMQCESAEVAQWLKSPTIKFNAKVRPQIINVETL